ncbi:C40 family peptidase [Acuticoccus mangrovi]|uniref:TIGR02594 family protein n=1 Tax=Acuticoccus mangrovi TaxID=2796142 RepID=A0A934IMV7_9HYPH|nr:TIGR02594 family protein [Acuticoccus mangrovi]MBJ3774810.1 TIGR02594 family protein [Acuticoccus mangrovi]
MTERVPWLDYLIHHIGVREIPGPQHHPLIVEWGKQAGIDWWNNDEDAWCAVAVNGALVNCGYPSTRSALARSFTRYGTKLTRPVPGAIVVFPRGSNPLYGHVGVVEQVNGDGTVTVINGNVSNEVRRSVFRIASILPGGLRWPPGAPPPVAGAPEAQAAELGERVLALGARGEDVATLQRDLNTLNYGLSVDGEFGGRTRDAVMRFEARRGLAADGVADAAMLAALQTAVTARRDRDSRREVATKAAAPIAGAGAAVTIGATVSAGVDIAKQVRSLNDGTAFGLVLVVAVIAACAGVFLWRFAIRRAEGPEGEEVL